MVAVIFRKVRHAPAVAMSRAAPGTVVSFASSTGKPTHARAPARHTITYSAVGALHNAMSGVSGRCFITPRETGWAYTLRAITPTPAAPAIAPCRKQNGSEHACMNREKNQQHREVRPATKTN